MYRLLNDKAFDGYLFASLFCATRSGLGCGAGGARNQCYSRRHSRPDQELPTAYK
jgi:hypothetical protein